MTARSSHGAIGLDARYATCSKLFEAERQELFRQQWLCVATKSELEQHSTLARQINGSSIILTCDETNEVNCFYNVCRHRGAKLIAEEHVSCAADQAADIVCPYHAWRYDKRGDLKTAPNMNEVADFDKKRFGLQRIECRTWNNLVWICFSENPPEFNEVFGKLIEKTQPWRIDQLQLHSSVAYRVNANWKLLFQNYNECYHCPTVHPALNRLTPYKNSHNDFEKGAILGGPMQLSADSQSMTSDGKFAGSPLSSLDPEQLRTVVYYTVFPTLFMSLHPDYVLFHRLVPLASNATQVYCDFFFEGETSESNRSSRDKAIRFWDETNRQDWKVCELVQLGMSNPGYIPGPYSNLESLVASFDRHYLSTTGYG